MTLINNTDIYAQQARVALAIINPKWETQTQPAAVHAFESAVVSLRSINDSSAAAAWVTATVSTVSAALV